MNANQKRWKRERKVAQVKARLLPHKYSPEELDFHNRLLEEIRLERETQKYMQAKYETEKALYEESI